MDRAVNQALHTLIPAWSGELPPELVRLAGSILAQSRSAVSSLKAEEEIARTYACSQIACERLKKTLSLPKIEEHPPCPPRVYQKLYKYLDESLKTSLRTPNKSSTPRQKGPSTLTTPSKSRTGNGLSASRSSKSHRVVSRGSKNPKSEDESFPEWVNPFTRRLCRKLGAPAATPHVFAGTASIMNSMKTHQSDALKDVKITALLVAVVFFVYSRLDGKEIEPAILSTRFAASRAVVEEFRKQGIKIDSLSESEIKQHIRMVVAEQGTRMEWFQNIRVGSGLGGRGDDDVPMDQEDAEVVEIDDETPPHGLESKYESPPPGAKYLKPGLGTMMQPKMDYLSRESLEDYAIWEAGIRRRIREMEEARETRMDTDEG